MRAKTGRKAVSSGNRSVQNSAYRCYQKQIVRYLFFGSHLSELERPISFGASATRLVYFSSEG